MLLLLLVWMIFCANLVLWWAKHKTLWLLNRNWMVVQGDIFHLFVNKWLLAWDYPDDRSYVVLA